MTNKTCPFTRSILERSMEGGYNFLSAMALVRDLPDDAQGA